MNKTALVVDDSKSARFALRKFLEGFNYKVETADSASEAYRLLGGALPEVIFMDHIMPGTDGFEALRILKSDPRTAAVPVVICSSNEGDEFVLQAKTRGASDVLQKPPSPEQLAGVLANLTSRAPSYSATLQPPVAESPLAHTLAPTLIPRREPTAMERLMATIPPKMIPTAHLLGQTLPPLQVSPPPPEYTPRVAPEHTAALPTHTGTVPLPAMPPRPTAPKVQPLREPAVTIQQAVMKSIRDSMPPMQEAAPIPAAPVVTAPAPLPRSEPAPSVQDIEQRVGTLRQELLGELAALRHQIANLGSTPSSEQLRELAAEAAQARTNALATTVEQHLTALRDNLDAVLRAQNDRIEQLLQTSRQTAAEEAERTVMKAAQRISDQMAESILKTLGPQLSSLRRG